MPPEYLHLTHRIVSLLGLAVMIGLAWILSENRARISWRLVSWALGLQFVIGLLLLPTPVQTYLFQPLLSTGVWVISLGRIHLESSPDELVFAAMDGIVNLLTDATMQGASMAFGRLAEDPSFGATFAFQVLPVIIVVSALSAVLYHLRIIQFFVRIVALIMRRTLHTSGVETFASALLVFLGIESVSAVRAYLNDLTRSELCTIMTTFMATIAGSVMVVYATFGAEPGHLLTASLMSAPAAILISKMLVPETASPRTLGAARVDLPVESRNLVDAAARGTSDGLTMALQVGAMVIAFMGLVYLLDMALAFLSAPLLRVIWAPLAGAWNLPSPEALSLESLLALLFAPFAFLLGVPLADVPEVARLLGTKTALNEFLAYMNLQTARDTMSPRAVMIATYALCGFANPGSLGICIAGLNGLIPGRRADVAALGLRSLIGGTLACFMTACIAGMMIYE